MDLSEQTYSHAHTICFLHHKQSGLHVIFVRHFNFEKSRNPKLFMCCLIQPLYVKKKNTELSDPA